jgi:hypothetical protein
MYTWVSIVAITAAYKYLQRDLNLDSNMIVGCTLELFGTLLGQGFNSNISRPRFAGILLL